MVSKGLRERLNLGPRLAWLIVALGVMLLGLQFAQLDVEAQGPFAAQIQAALRAAGFNTPGVGDLTVTGNISGVTINASNRFSLASSGDFFWVSRSIMRSAADGSILLTNQAGTGFSTLNLGCATASCPQLAVSGAGVLARLADGTANTFVTAAFFNGNASSIIASGATIAPTGSVHHISGVAAIATVTVPTGCTPTCTITLIPDGLWTTTTGGNISLATTAVVNKSLILAWDGTKWNPSY